MYTIHLSCWILHHVPVDYQDIQFGELIGRGSYGAVHKGVWRGNTVALKRIPITPEVDTSQVFASNKEIAALRYSDYT